MLPDNVWDELNEEYRQKRQTLLDQLKELDIWYEERFVLLSLTNKSPL